MSTLYGCNGTVALWDNQAVATAPKQSERSRQTDIKVAESAANAVRRDGFDQLALTRVAADAGYSSGVIYARCDDRSELMVLAWEKSFWPSLSEVLEAAVTAVLTRDQAGLESALSLWAERSLPTSVPDIGSAAEVIVAARRDEVVAEVVHSDLNALLSRFGAGPGTTGPERELVLLTVATLIGTSLLNSAMPDDTEIRIEPSPLLQLFAARPEPKGPTHPVPVTPGTTTTPLTGDEVRDALINAAEYVIARSGVHRSTVSRIARRAKVSVGAIYGLYENKETLVLDCISVIHPPQARRELEEWARIDSAEIRGTMSRNLTEYLSTDHDQWRLFRLECLVAARHSPALARMIEDFNVDTIEGLNANMPMNLLRTIPARGTVAGLAILATVDRTMSELTWNWFPIG